MKHYTPLPDLEAQREELAAAGLDVDDTCLGPLPPPPAPERPVMRQAGRIRFKPRADTATWDKEALCYEIKVDPDAFFPVRSSTVEEIGTTKEICTRCPVRWQCLAYSVINWEKLGIWGGRTEIERREVRKDLKQRIADGLLDPSDLSLVEWYLAQRWGQSERPIPRGAGAAKSISRGADTRGIPR